MRDSRHRTQPPRRASRLHSGDGRHSTTSSKVARFARAGFTIHTHINARVLPRTAAVPGGSMIARSPARARGDLSRGRRPAVLRGLARWGLTPVFRLIFVSGATSPSATATKSRRLARLRTTPGRSRHSRVLGSVPRVPRRSTSTALERFPDRALARPSRRTCASAMGFSPTRSSTAVGRLVARWPTRAGHRRHGPRCRRFEQQAG